MPDSLHNALLIHNPNAGNGGRARESHLTEARRIFATGGIQTDLAETTGPGHATEIAHRASAEGRQLVIACGGDGTLNEIINGLATQANGHRVPLALLPGGTANILAKELDIPWNIPKAAEILVRGEVKEIALGLATPLEQPERKKYFLSVAGAGPDGMIVYSLDLTLKARFGILAYWWQGARQVFAYKFPRFRVRILNPEPEPQTNGHSPAAHEISMDSSLVVVGRTKNYGGPFKITDQADLFQPRFEVLTLTTQSGFRYLSYLPQLWLNKLRGESGVHFHKTTAVICEPLDKNPIYAQIDGEPLARLPVEFRIIPQALKLLVPTSSA
jgi:diacylglycerol kinase (ATP)